MNFAEAIKSCFNKYVTFSGRAPRSEYWFWVLFTLIIGIVVGVIEAILGTAILGAILNLALFLPGLAVGVRRLHDIDRSGWWWFIILIPLIGAIILLIWFCKKGTAGENRFGPDPLK